MPHPHLAVETSPAGYRWLRLARPERRNALDVSLLRAVTDALAADPGDPVLLASTDPRAFCAGADLTISAAERAAVSDLVYDCCEAIVTRPGPVIAVLTGPAVGGGAQLAAACDLRIASPAARLRWTGRWVGAAEALALGLVNQVCEDPGPVAAGIAAGLAGRTWGVKAVMAAGALLDRMRAERAVNRTAWARVLPPA